MNLTEMDDADAKRLVDFAAGLVFGSRGTHRAGHQQGVPALPAERHGRRRGQGADRRGRVLQPELTACHRCRLSPRSGGPGMIVTCTRSSRSSTSRCGSSSRCCGSGSWSTGCRSSRARGRRPGSCWWCSRSSTRSPTPLSRRCAVYPPAADRVDRHRPVVHHRDDRGLPAAVGRRVAGVSTECAGPSSVLLSHQSQCRRYSSKEDLPVAAAAGCKHVTPRRTSKMNGWEHAADA